MGNAANVQFIAQTEPWRCGQGMPVSSLDPIWAHDSIEKCAGTINDVEWEPGTEWWWCRKCGKCSNAHYLGHYIVETPRHYLDLSYKQFMTRRRTQGFPVAEAEDQARHIMGVALRVAAADRPESFGRLVENILQLGR